MNCNKYRPPIIGCAAETPHSCSALAPPPADHRQLEPLSLLSSCYGWRVAVDCFVLMQQFDLIVIGSGPAGQRAAIQAAKADKRVALMERGDVLGGDSINTGTIPSKTMREAVLHFSGYRYKPIYGINYSVKEQIRMPDLMFPRAARDQDGNRRCAITAGAQRCQGSHRCGKLRGPDARHGNELARYDRLRSFVHPHRHGDQASHIGAGAGQWPQHHQ